MRRFALAVLVAGGVSLAGAAVGTAQEVAGTASEADKGFLANFVQERLSSPERQIGISNIDGALGSDVSIREITISDQQGVWLRVTNARLTWNQAALFLGRLEVSSLTADSIDYIRNAVPAEGVDLPPPEAGALQIPQFPVAVILQQLSVPKVTFGEAIFGLGSEISLAGGLTLQDGDLNANLDVVRLDGPGGTLDLDVVYTGQTNAIDLGLALVEPENGVIANLLNIENRPAVTLTLKGAGPVADLRTDLVLQTNEQTALSGTATIQQQPEGFAVDADLRGPLSTLVAEQYRPFFGAETALSANALLRSEGGFSITGLRLSGGQLSLEVAADTTPDNFLRTLALNAVIADSNGAPVTLPVPGSATQVNTAQLAVAFGGEGNEDWNATLAVAGYKTDGFAADNVALMIGGVASNLNNPLTRRVTFNGDGSVSGLAASQEVEAALGDAIGIGIAGLWNSGQPVELAELRVAGEALTAALSGQLNGLDFTGDIGIETASIAPFAGLAGRQLNGGLSLKATGSIMPVSGGFDLTLDGTGTDLRIDDELADRLLAGNVALTGRVARGPTGLSADDFRIANQQVQVLADGTYSSEIADFAFNLDLSDLALLSEQASGPLKIMGTAKGADSVIDLDLTGTVASGTLAGRQLREASLGFAGQYRVDTLAGTISGEAGLDGFRTALSAGLNVSPAEQALSNIEFQAAGTRITGDLAHVTLTGLVNGAVNVVSPDVSVPAALALLKASGAVNADVTLEPENGKQSASVRADVRGLRVNDVAVGAADVSADIGDLFGVPVINGSVNGTDIAAAGVTVRRLMATAAQSGTSTSFDAQAALATGTDVDVAGALTPVEGGYRLALERAELAQGELSARLAQPTVLQIAGSNVSLEALRFDVGSGSISATGSAGAQLDITLDINALPLSIANAVLPNLGLAGTLSGRANIGGTGSDPRVRFEAQGQGINANAIDGYGIAPLRLAATGSYAGNVVTLASLRADGSGGLTLSGSGTVPLTGGGLDVAVSGSAPLALGNQYVLDRGGQLSGVLNLDARVSGSLASPQFGGRVSTRGAGYVDPELNLRLQNITGSASLNGSNLQIDTLSAGLATGGTVSASGSVGLTGGLPANVRIGLNSARYADGNLFVATASGDLALTGNLAGSPLLSGNVFVEEANITVPESFGGGAELIDVEHVRTPPAVEQTLTRARIDESGAPVPQTRPGGVLLDINVNAPNQIF
ncbi:MAG TPA: translocation/assembly module TamB, partial [Devosia sp.]